MFLFFFYLTTLLVRSSRRDPRAWWRAVLIGFVIYLAIGTRVVGISLAAGLALYGVVRLRTISRSTVVSIAVCGAFVSLQRYVTGIGLSGYRHEHPTFHSIASNIAIYTRATASFWVGSTRNLFAYAVLAILVALVVKGIFAQENRRFTLVEAALIPYLTIIVVPVDPGGIRMMFPAVPWFGYLALSGLKGLVEKSAARYSAGAVWTLILLIAIPYGQVLSETGLRPNSRNCGSAGVQPIVSGGARKHRPTRSDSLHSGPSPLALYGAARLRAQLPWDTGGALQWAENIHAKYLLTTNAFNDDQGFLASFVASNAGRFDLVYENANFRLYRIRSFPAGFDRLTKLAIAAPPA